MVGSTITVGNNAVYLAGDGIGGCLLPARPVDAIIDTLSANRCSSTLFSLSRFGKGVIESN